MANHPILFIPGPVEVEEELRQVMARPLLGHRHPDFVSLVPRMCEKLRELFQTRDAAMFENCPATMLMEAAIRNLVTPGGSILHLTNGAFSERWAEISQACGRSVDTLAVPWGSTHDPEQLREKLLTSPPYEAVTITHSETSTGALEPLAELATVVREVSAETLVLVDAVSSLAGAELQFDAWQLDLALAGTQKCLALPPGLTVYAVSERALERAAEVPGRGYLLDFPKARQGMEKGRAPATPCVPLVWALDLQLDRIAKETLAGRWARHLEMRHITLDWAEQHGFSPFVADAARRSPTVTCLNASGRDVPKLAERARQAGYLIDKGYGKIKGETFRIGHMGDHNAARLKNLLAALE